MATLASSKERLLITGSRGYIGSLLSPGLSYLSIDLQNSGPQHFKDLDAFDPGLSVFSEVETVVHLADRRLQDIHRQNLSDNIETHRGFLKKLNDLPRLKKVIWASSCSVYGFSDQEIHEASPVNPTSFYAESKLAVERLIQDLALPSLILRFGTAHGWSPSMRLDLFVNQLVEAVSQGKEMEIYSPEAWRPYIHCRDFARRLQSEVSGDRIGTWNVVTENFRKSEILSLPSLVERTPKFRVKKEEDPRNYRVRLAVPSEGYIDMNQSISEMMKRFEDAKT